MRSFNENTENKRCIINILFIVLVVLISVFPLVFMKDADFEGADGQAEGVIVEINENYEPWFLPLYEPASGEIESLLFVLQAALGAGFIGYYLGMAKERKHRDYSVRQTDSPC
ncbi:MAG: energy-coupling factor ABC transporter substrate-binding protein [Firmicutes bacterium]|nr:energy-coupling factor ABC transporter substrate-binding protein [Bacillota bacterium]